MLVMQRLLILATKLGYQTRGFGDAARRMGVEVVFGTDRCHRLENPWGDDALALDFKNAARARDEIVAAAKTRRVDGILAVGDAPVRAAALAAEALGIRFHTSSGVQRCQNKFVQGRALREGGVAMAQSYGVVPAGGEPELALDAVRFPCVVKPFDLSASQGVIRANDAEEFCAAVRRVQRLLARPEIQSAHPGAGAVLVEEYLPGKEVAVEGLMTGGELRVLAIFDKPDELEGPYFEETIYVTPSRLDAALQQRIEATARDAVRVLGLSDGPVHAEFRVNERGVFAIEIAARPIGGLCSRALRFARAAGADSEPIYLEELLVRHALGEPCGEWAREAQASGVMMIPVPRSGVLEGVQGEEAALAVRHVEELHITARMHDTIVAWPEGASYLGFIFARAETPEQVEVALREAHAKLNFEIRSELPVEHPLAARH